MSDPSLIHRESHFQRKQTNLTRELEDMRCPHPRGSMEEGRGRKITKLQNLSTDEATRSVHYYKEERKKEREREREREAKLSYLLAGVSVSASILITAVFLPSVVELCHLLEALGVNLQLGRIDTLTNFLED